MHRAECVKDMTITNQLVWWLRSCLNANLTPRHLISLFINIFLLRIHYRELELSITQTTLDVLSTKVQSPWYTVMNCFIWLCLYHNMNATYVLEHRCRVVLIYTFSESVIKWCLVTGFWYKFYVNNYLIIYISGGHVKMIRYRSISAFVYVAVAG